MNREAMSKTRDRIAEVGNGGCDMNNWIGPTKARTALAGEAACGTTGCIAGHALAVHHGTLYYTASSERFAVKNPTGRGTITINPAARGADILALTYGEAANLFHASNWPEEHKSLRLAEGDAKAMLKVLDDLLDGILVFKENGELVKADEF
jgi:hypothetical protein